MEEMKRYTGSLLGMAIGDALGTTNEFLPRKCVKPISDIVGGGTFRLKPGEWTDDTSMALCLAKSLLDCEGFDAADQMDRYVLWQDKGYLSSNGRCFDIGGTVASALRFYKRTGNPYAGSTNEMSAGNGSLMRIAPIALYYANSLERASYMAEFSSMTTHAAPLAIEACSYYTELIVLALQGKSKAEILSHQPAKGFLTKEIADIASGAYKAKKYSQIETTGFVLHSLEAALWIFYHTSNFKRGCLMAANMGHDADTTAAIYGQLAGAYYGEDGLPAKWRNIIVRKDFIRNTAIALYNASRS